MVTDRLRAHRIAATLVMLQVVLVSASFVVPSAVSVSLRLVSIVPVVAALVIVAAADWRGRARG